MVHVHAGDDVHVVCMLNIVVVVTEFVRKRLLLVVLCWFGILFVDDFRFSDPYMLSSVHLGNTFNTHM